MSSFLSAPGLGFFDKLTHRAQQIDSLLCVGLDPHAQELGEEKTASGAKSFCLRLIEATSGVALAFKPNAAFFEAFGAEGMEALKEVIAAVPKDIPVILDAKRGDIGTTAVAYASAAFEELGAHAITLNAYMGYDTVKPFLGDPSRGVFVLCKTSNASSNELQTLAVSRSGETASKSSPSRALFEEIACLCKSWNAANNVGLVVGATDADALRRARTSAPDLWILAPGVGAQGGDLDEACSAALDSKGMGLLIPVSRGISRAKDPAAAAAQYRDSINLARKRCTSEKKEIPKQGAPRGQAQGTPEALILPYQREFIEFSLEQQVLRFGDFELKSGRRSPYFFNAGLFCSGAALAKLGKFYAAAIVSNQPPLDFDVVFGPAYKGISIGAAVALTLAERHGRDVGFAYNRKEAKDHGEGGSLVGADLKGKRVLVVDDVITGGTAIRESMDVLGGAGAVPAGVVIALDRQERTGAEPEEGSSTGACRSGISGMSAIQQVEEAFGVPVVSVVALSHLTEFMAARGDTAGVDVEALKALRVYREKYGVA